MASTYSIRFRLNFQAPGDNLNLWGNVLNVGVFQLLEDAMAKRVAFALSGSKTLTTANGAADEARCAFLDVTGGTGGTITAPSVEKPYIVRNGASGDVIVTTGAGLTATIAAGEVVLVIGDGTNFRRVQTTSFGGARLSNIADPVANQDAATKAYADALAWAGAAGFLPLQAGNAGKYLVTDGIQATWANLSLMVDIVTGVSTGRLSLKNSGGTVLGGIWSNNTGDVDFLNAAGAARLQTKSDGSVRVFTDAEAGVGGQLLATQAFSIAAAVSL